MTAYIKLLIFVIWPGIVAVIYGFMFLTPEYQFIYYKWIAFVYVMVLPVIVYAFIDQRRYDYECQRLKERKK